MRHVAALLCVSGWLASGPIGAAEPGSQHEHHAPHGGTLIVLGDEFAHLELVLNGETGALRAYVLDGEAERGVPVQQGNLAIDIAPTRGDPFRADLAPVENVLTGEVIGNSSEFAGRSDRLVGLRRFEGTLRQLDVKGQSFRDVHFRFPQGNEAPTPGDAEGQDPHRVSPGTGGRS
jgi:hypothetical protein